jgi:hypothetical protein
MSTFDCLICGDCFHIKIISSTANKCIFFLFNNETIFRESKVQAIREGYTFSEIVELVLEYYLSNLAYTDKELKEIKEARKTKSK